MPRKTRRNLVGERFEKLVVIKFVFTKNNKVFYSCECDCGTKDVVVDYNKLISKHTKSCGCLRSSFRKDLTGKKIGRLKIISYAYSTKKGECYWNCECDCGAKNLIIFGSGLKKETTLSCGCYNREITSALAKQRTKEKNPTWTGIGDLSGVVYFQLKRNAKIRKIFFNLSKEYLWDLFLKQNKKCALSGIDLFFPKNKLPSTGNASLDRIDSSKDYIEGNVQWVTKKINLMKQSFSQQKFIDICKLILEYNKEKLERKLNV